MLFRINAFLKDNSPLFAALFGLAFIYLGISFIHRIEKDGGTDFNVYYQAGKLINKGMANELYTFTTGRGWHYNYPPLFAILISPLSILPLREAGLVWYLLNLVFLFFSLRLLLRLRSEDSLLPLAFTIIYGAGAVGENLMVGQVNILITLIILISFSLIEKEKGFAAGILLSLASTIKVIPIILFFYFFLKPKRRVFMGGFVGFLLFLLIIPSLFLGVRGCLTTNLKFAKEMILPHLGAESGGTIYALKTDITATANQSLNAVLARFFSRRGEVFPSIHLISLSPSSVKLIASLTQFLLFFLTLFFTLVKRRRATLLELSLFIPLMFLLSPEIKLRQLPPLAIVPFFLIGDGLLKTNPPKKHRLLAIIFLLLSFVSLSLIGMRYFQLFGVGLAGVFFLWLSLSLLLLGMGKELSN
ncbi:MAG: DUF2029 domain-containing protein [Acidobacteria bacterium]|nr:DUF2029 domain-containing protein [Acidobacteriota bacterium]